MTDQFESRTTNIGVKKPRNSYAVAAIFGLDCSHPDAQRDSPELVQDFTDNVHEMYS